MIKKYPLWVSVIFAVLSFVALYPLSATPIAYYALGFVAFSIIVFAVILYFAITKSFTQNNCIKLILLVVVSALPHLVLCLLNYGSWVCLGVSGAIIILLAIK
ncbi:hypothetical protein AN639_02900 [Candidatus Epulonipiscium fishelsonii]|uniref:Uncharacterized protein n=1 Tax=Candidatus Epulonipiscium fishelsonii TaxID=77094 RepID=A0ACC8XD44_9FIRM|nr:hypothetical protein AN396_05590 [Epulopiscium sp. SCG-B11WGA-EpuloA1]ONI41778.1 hypothetical protein AN639_02900 [Epulopiscium sp. SCG-B05WGA-EpuloA1]